MFRQQLRRDLRLGRFVMDLALSAPAALQQVEAIPDPSLILIPSDINMPGMTGLEMLPNVKAERPNVPVIMITAYARSKLPKPLRWTCRTTVSQVARPRASRFSSPVTPRRDETSQPHPISGMVTKTRHHAAVV